MSFVVSDMVDSKIKTISRSAQWKPQYFGSAYSQNARVNSDAFKIGMWNWQLAFEFERQECLLVRLSLQPSPVSETQPPWARFSIRVTDSRKSKYDSSVEERVFCDGLEYVFSVKCYIYGHFIIDVEFVDLRISQPDGTNTMPILPHQSVAAERARRRFSSMLHQSNHADVTIKTPNGSIEAHKAVLAASSPVFSRMFTLKMEEKQSFGINLEGMSQEACMTFIGYLYGDMKQEDFLEHRVALLEAAKKYQVADLKDVCEESLLEDINLENALERLQFAWLYELHKLKRGCFKYLFELGKVRDIPDKYRNFLRDADRDLTRELMLDIISLKKPT